MSIKKLIENPHPIYARYYDYWNFLLESYEGGIDYTQSGIKEDVSKGVVTVKVNGKPLERKRRSNLFKHKKEREEDYFERIDMSYYYNFCSPIIDIYTNHLFKDPVISEWENIETPIESRIDNIDLKGSSIVEFRKELSEMCQIFGHCYVVTDKPQTDIDIISLAQQMENDMFPYLTIFKPTDLLNWSLDEFGHPHWVLLRESYNGNIDPTEFDPKKSNVINYRIWTRQEWILFNEDGEEITRGTHALGKVPIDIAYNKPSKKYRNFLGISELADISFIARDVYNKCSELNEILRNQTFAILCLQGKSSEYDEASVGTSKALVYPEETNVPQYISPQAENARTLMDQIQSQVHKMFQLAKLTGGSASQINEIKSQSGIAKAFDFQETNSALAKKASHLEDAEMRIWDSFARWEGHASFEGSISYSKDFNISDLNEDLEEAEKLMKMQLGKEFNVEYKKQIIKKSLPRVPKQQLDKIISEMESKEGTTQGNSIRERIPNLFDNNASLGGPNRRISNVRN